MPVSRVLTPTTLASTDYSTAQNPVLGGEALVYLSTSPSRLLGTAQLTSDGVISYKYVGLPAVSQGPIVAIAIGGGIFQAAADTITFAGLTGSFSPSGWSSITNFNFPVGRAVELAGTYSTPSSASVPTLGLSPGAGMLAGSQFALMELPPWTSFILAGCTTSRNITVPSRGTKNIACGMNEAEWTVPGVVKAGMLEVDGLNQGWDDGLLRFSGVKCQAAIVILKEGRLTTSRAICVDWTGECKAPLPTGESEGTVSLSGSFSKLAAFPAP